MKEKLGPDQLPPGIHRGRFEHTAELVTSAIDAFGLHPPLTLYYPGSSTDVSLIGLPGLQTIHVDDILSDIGLAGFEQLGAEAHRADAHSWRPPVPVDIVAFIVSTGIDEDTVLKNTDLKAGGLVIWASEGGLPIRLLPSTDLELVGVAQDASSTVIDVEDLEKYFDPKEYSELSEGERVLIGQAAANYAADLGQEQPMPTEDFYALARQYVKDLLAKGLFIDLPRKKEGNFFIFKKRST